MTQPKPHPAYGQDTNDCDLIADLLPNHTIEYVERIDNALALFLSGGLRLYVDSPTLYRDAETCA